MKPSTKVRISYGVAAIIAAVRTIQIARHEPTVWLWIRSSIFSWTVVAVLLVVAFKVRDDQPQRTTGVMMGAGLIIAPFVVYGILTFYREWLWVAAGIAVLIGVVNLRSIGRPAEGSTG